ncbi:MAG TPA: hypothetical protein VLV29_06185 [Steroidobacteraceae bacterium]|nr:hypothetical protein [Steroidobacteraceae bacterium]
MRLSWNLVALDTLGALRLRGADVGAFLQGQLSNDMTRLSAQRALLAGYHNAQGRAIALLRLVQLGADDVLAVLPRELVAPVAARLGKFVLRAKVRLQDDSPQWIIEGALASGAAQIESQPQVPGARDEVRHAGDTLIVRCSQAPARFLLIRPAGTPATLEGLTPLRLLDWKLASIAAGEPQVYAATSEEFVAQMLNLDLLGGIAFDKGCYSGQEVIARAHYRGRVKRRMQRFLTRAARELRPGDAGTFEDGRGFKVVEAARGADGNGEFLAVTALSADPAAAATAGEPLAASELPLPYPLPQ